MTTRPRASYAPRRTPEQIAAQKAQEAADKAAAAVAAAKLQDAALTLLRRAYAHRKSVDAAAVRADDALTEVVRAARATGVTWQVIGDEIAMTRSNVVRKYTTDDIAGRLPAAEPKIQDAALAKLRKAFEAREKANAAAVNADEALTEVVYAARDTGVTLQTIGDELEMWQSGAAFKYAAEKDPRSKAKRRKTG